MSNLLLPSTPIYGHVSPMVNVARGLIERGHTVTILTGYKFRDLVEKNGIRFLPLPAEIDYDDANFDSFLPGRAELSGLAAIRYDLIGLFIQTIPAQHRALTAELEANAYDAVVLEAGFLGARPLLRSTPRSERIPFITVSPVNVTLTSVDTAPFGPAIAPGSSALSRLRNRLLNAIIHGGPLKPAQTALMDAFAEVGATAPVGNFFDQFIVGDATLQLAPAGIEYPRRELPETVRFIGPLRSSSPAQAELPDWWSDLDRGMPVVHVTQGTLDNIDLTKLLVPTIEGLADADVLVVAATGGRPVSELLEHFPHGIPANARVAEFLPYDHLLPRTSVVVSNGGFGGVLQALANGIPLVVAGSTEDKPEVAARVAWSGAGRNLRTGTPKAAQVKRAVLEVLAASTYRTAARRLQSEIAELGDPLDTIAATIEAQITAEASSSAQK